MEKAEKAEHEKQRIYVSLTNSCVGAFNLYTEGMKWDGETYVKPMALFSSSVMLMQYVQFSGYW